MTQSIHEKATALREQAAREEAAAFAADEAGKTAKAQTLRNLAYGRRLRADGIIRRASQKDTT